MSHQLVNVNDLPILTLDVKTNIDIIEKSIKERFDFLELETLAPTLDNQKDLRDARAFFKNEFNEYESERKDIKNHLLAPYNEFNALYDEKIKKTFDSIDKILNDKITSINVIRLAEKTNYQKEYFSNKIFSMELNKFPWITISSLHLDNISMNDSEKLIRDSIDFALKKVVDDLNVISHLEFSNEIFIEYSESLDLTNSILLVKTRQEKLKQIYHGQIETEKKIISEILNDDTDGELIKVQMNFLATEKQLQKISNFFDDMKIEYEVIDDDN